ncbi:MAG: isopentenyl-diphosphate Delta-isomerase [Bacteroidota bacterium]|jgi:isopentenyl-diphosphate delta-isomerase
MEFVVLVDELDQPKGTMEKLEAHKQGLLHRAFSIFIFNSKKELLLQKRASQKYHCGGLWTNTCCSHQRPNESTMEAANRRLQEEMGMTCELESTFSFVYKAAFDNGLTEHEFDHVLIGHTDASPDINKEEVDSFKYMGIEDIQKDLEINSHLYTPWFKIAMEKLTLTH